MKDQIDTKRLPTEIFLQLIPIRATLFSSNRCEAEGITASGRAPVLDLCRNFVEAGNDPNRRAALFNPTQNNCSKEARDERQG